MLPEWHLFSNTLWVGMPTRQHVPDPHAGDARFPGFQVFGGEDRDPWLAAAGCETPHGITPREGDLQKV